MKQVGHSNRKCETFGGSKLVCSDSCWSFGGGKGHNIGPKRVLGPSQGVQGGTREAPRRHQGGTKEAPGRHQGGTEETPRKDLHIDMGPRAHHFQRVQSRT